MYLITVMLVKSYIAVICVRVSFILMLDSVSVIDTVQPASYSLYNGLSPSTSPPSVPPYNGRTHAGCTDVVPGPLSPEYGLCTAVFHIPHSTQTVRRYLLK